MVSKFDIDKSLYYKLIVSNIDNIIIKTDQST